MLHDSARNEWYARAIAAAVALRPGGLVLDIGTGSGLLALLASRQPAAGPVFACEADHRLQAVAEVTLAAAAADAPAATGAVTLLRKRSTELEVPRDLPRRAAVVVSEILDSALLGEDVVPTLAHAAAHLAAPDAIFVPARATILAWPLSAPTLYRHCHDLATLEPGTGEGRCGAAAPLPALEEPGSCAGQPHPMQLHLGRAGRPDSVDAALRHLAEPAVAATLDFGACADIPTDDGDAPWRHQCVRLALRPAATAEPAVVHGVGVAFTLLAAGLPDEDAFATWPEPAPPAWREHWRPCFYPLATPLVVEGRQHVTLHSWLNARLLRFDVRADDGGGAETATADCGRPPAPLQGCRSGAHTVYTPQAIQLTHDCTRRRWILEAVRARARQAGRAQHVVCVGDGSLDWIELAVMGADAVASVVVCVPHLYTHKVGLPWQSRRVWRAWRAWRRFFCGRCRSFRCSPRCASTLHLPSSCVLSVRSFRATPGLGFSS